MLCKCDKCGHTWQLGAFEERSLGDDRIATGFECPACHAWYLAFVTDTKARRMQAELRQAIAKAAALPPGDKKGAAIAAVSRQQERLKEHMGQLKRHEEENAVKPLQE